MDTSALQQEILFRSKPIKTEPNASYRISYDLQISSGGVAVNVMNGELTAYRHQFIRNYPQGWGKEAYVITAQDRNVIITVGAYNAEPRNTGFHIRDFLVDRVRLR